MTDLERLLARTEISELKARYCRTLDTKDWDAWTALFTEDVEVDVSADVTPDLGNPAFRGREIFVEQTRRFLQSSGTVHHVHGLELEFHDEASAVGVWGMYDRIVFQPEAALPFSAITGHGFYHERYHRTVDGWKIAALRLARTVRSVEARA